MRTVYKKYTITFGNLDEMSYKNNVTLANVTHTNGRRQTEQVTLAGSLQRSSRDTARSWEDGPETPATGRELR